MRVGKKACNGPGRTPVLINDLAMKALNLPLFVILFSGAILAQTNPVLNGFIGKWEGKGTLMAAETAFDMQWEWVLEGSYLRVEFKSERTVDDGSISVFAGHGYYLFEGDKFTGTWFDSRRISFPLKGDMGEHTLTSYWGSPEIEEGVTEYTLLANGEMRVTDKVLRNGSYIQFSEALYQKKQ